MLAGFAVASTGRASAVSAASRADGLRHGVRVIHAFQETLDGINLTTDAADDVKQFLISCTACDMGMLRVGQIR